MEGFEHFKELIKVGTVSSVNPEKGRLRVRFDESDIVSKELLMLSFEYNMPSIGDRVLCIFLSNTGEDGFCLGGFYSDQNKPPARNPEKYHKDILGEASIEYDKRSKVLTINAPRVVINEG